MKLFILSLFTLFTFSSTIEEGKTSEILNSKSSEILYVQDCFEWSISAANVAYDAGYSDSVATCFANQGYAACRGYAANYAGCVSTIDQFEAAWNNIFG